MTFGSTFGRTFSPTFQPKSQAAASAAAFVPTDISGCLLWYDFSDANYLFTDAGSTKVSSDGDAIYQVNDKSGNNYHGVQTTLASRPLYKTGIQNSKSIARFDGVANGSHFNISMTATSGSFTMIACFYDNVTGVTHIPKGLFDTQTGRLIFLPQTTDGSGKIGWYDGSYKSIATVTHQTWGIRSWVLNSGTSNGVVYLNGSSLGNAAYSAKAIGGRVRLCAFQDTLANYLLAADMCEVVLYHSALSDTDRGKVETYLNNKWAIY